MTHADAEKQVYWGDGHVCVYMCVCPFLGGRGEEAAEHAAALVAAFSAAAHAPACYLRIVNSLMLLLLLLQHDGLSGRCRPSNWVCLHHHYCVCVWNPHIAQVLVVSQPRGMIALYLRTLMPQKGIKGVK